MTVTKKGDVVIGAKDEASKKFKTISGSLSDLGSVVTGINQAMEIAAKGMRLASEAYDFGRTGAEVEKTEFAFRRMASSVGANADVILAELKDLTGGTISEFELMQKTAKATTLGIPIDKVAEFAEVARAAAAAMGESTSFMFDSIVTGTARQSKLILDNLGIIIKEGEVYEKEVQRLGRALTDTEKRQAFLNAVLVSGQAIIKDIGDTSGLAFEQFAAFESTLEDTKNTIALIIGQEFGDVLAEWNTELSGFVKSSEFEETLSLLGDILVGIAAVAEVIPGVLLATKDFFIEIVTGGTLVDGVWAILGERMRRTNENMENARIAAEGFIGPLREIGTVTGGLVLTDEELAAAAALAMAETKKQNQAAFDFFEAEVARLGALEQLRQDIAIGSKSRSEEEKERIEDRLDFILATETEIANFLILEQARKKIADKKFTDAQVKEFINAERAKQRAFQDTADLMIVGMDSLSGSLKAILDGATLNFKNIFQDMANAFGKHFIDKVTEMLRDAVIRWAAMLGLRALGLSFGIPIPGGGGGPLGDFPISASIGGGFGGGNFGGSNIVISVQGSIIGDEAFVTDVLIPQIENAILNRETNLNVGLT